MNETSTHQPPDADRPAPDHPEHERPRKSHRGVVTVAIAMLSVMVGLVIYSPTLYRMFCAATGYGGAVNRTTTKEIAGKAEGRAIKVRFDANVAPDLDWDFAPEQRTVETRIGEATKVYYTAHNRTDHPIVARATYNVTPYYAAPYFFKIECFCFTEERLDPGETARMPLVFYIDEQLEKDEDAAKTSEVTLSYTFFKSTDQSQGNLAAARALKSGSQALDDQLSSNGKAQFSVDAKRVGSGSPVVR